MARTAPVPNIPAIPGMNPGVFVMGGGGGSGGGNGKGGGAGRNSGGAQGSNGGYGANGGGKNAGACGPGSGGGCPNPAHGGGGGTHAGDPVDPITGRVYTLPVVDLALGGPLPLVISRSYTSACREDDIGLGHGWLHSYGHFIECRRRKFRLVTPDAGPVEAVLPEVGTSLDLPTGRLIRLRDGFILQGPDRRAYFFGPASSSPSRFHLLRVSDTNGNAIRLTYRQDALDTITDSVGRLIRVRRGSGGRILSFEVMRASHGGWTRFRAYEYNDAGDLVRATDASGQAETYVYGADHLLVTQLSATGLTVHYKYDEFGRCVESFALRVAGDSGLADDVPATLADRQTAAKGFLHVRLNYYDDFSEVITSRSIRRVEGNAQSRYATLEVSPSKPLYQTAPSPTCAMISTETARRSTSRTAPHAGSTMMISDARSATSIPRDQRCATSMTSAAGFAPYGTRGAASFDTTTMRTAVQAAQQAPRGSGPSAQDQAARRRRWAGADPNASVPNAGVFGHDDQGRWQRQDQSPNAPPRQS
ncbi:DUF6531 domain-containing protein [Sorangium sp. So ce542]|uniref:DUF6531 domain-containing protein n=1 Tax=Sorangium sp. So ce542 TaxID=3133316 RepID=UPI003F5FAB25